MKKQNMDANCMDDEEDIVEKFIRENNVKIVNFVYLYIIECKNGAFYTGVTKDFFKRWKQHRSGTGAKYVKANGFKKPVFLQHFDTLSEAMKEEKRIKKLSRKQKEELIKGEGNILDNLYYMDFSVEKEKI